MRPACVLWPAPCFHWEEARTQVGQSPHVRDGHAPFFCGAKSNFKETLVLLPLQPRSARGPLYIAFPLVEKILLRKSVKSADEKLRASAPSREPRIAALFHLQYVVEGAERFEDAGDLILALPIRAHEATPQQLLQNQPHQD